LKNHQKKLTILTFFGLLLNIYTIHSQTIKEIEVFNFYDKTVGKQNLDINNGIVFTDPYSSPNGNIFFTDDKFENGSLSYEGQIYYDTSLKYDIYRDILILNPQGTSSFVGINLIKEKVESFSIYNRKFVKLNKEQFNLANFTSGYYEILENSSDFAFYTKHNKLMQKKVDDDRIIYQFKKVSSHYLFYKKNLYKADSKSEILKVFPDQKKQINEFYLTNRDIRKSDPDQFMEKLMKNINSSLSKQTK
jgi:hypothetical protein